VTRNAAEVNGGPSRAGWGFQVLYLFLWSVSFFAAVGGTTMQVVGVFRNCICASLAGTWGNLWHNNPSINLATDTQDARSASYYWILMGAIATAFVGSVTYIGWWYQKVLRHRFTEAVRNLYIQGSIPPTHGVNAGLAASEDFEMVRPRNQDKAVSLAADVISPIDTTRLLPETLSPFHNLSPGSRWSSTSSQGSLIIGGFDGREDGVDSTLLG
jgi:hypothetical protein